jgi:lactate permease
VDVVSAISSMSCLALFLKVWRPAYAITEAPADWSSPVSEVSTPSAQFQLEGSVVKAWLPWVVLSLCLFLWGVPQFKGWLDALWIAKFQVFGLHNLVQKVPPVVAKSATEAAVYTLNLLSATGTGILLAAILSGLFTGYRLTGLLTAYWRTLVLLRYSLLTIACMLALGFVTRYSGTDATLGLAFARSGWLYPLFGTFIGWLGVALTGSDTSSNVLFGGLQPYIPHIEQTI